MSKRPHPTVTITAKLPIKMAEDFYEVVNSDYEGNISAALREAVKRLINELQPRSKT